MERREELAAAALGLTSFIFSLKTCLNVKKRRRNNRKIWVREWIGRRSQGKAVTSLINEELRMEDKMSFRNYLRMTEESFEKLLSLVTPHIQKADTVMRESIPPSVR